MTNTVGLLLVVCRIFLSSLTLCNTLFLTRSIQLIYRDIINIELRRDTTYFIFYTIYKLLQHVSARPTSGFYPKLIQPELFHTLSLSPVLIISFHVHRHVANGLLAAVCTTKNECAFILVPCVLHVLPNFVLFGVITVVILLKETACIMAIPLQAWGLQELKDPRNWYMKVVRLSALCTSRLEPSFLLEAESIPGP